MKVDVGGVATGPVEVPYVLGGVYRFRLGGYRVLVRVSIDVGGDLQRFFAMVDPTNGAQANSWTSDVSVRAGVNNGDYTYIPGATLHIPKEVG